MARVPGSKAVRVSRTSEQAAPRSATVVVRRDSLAAILPLAEEEAGI